MIRDERLDPTQVALDPRRLTAAVERLNEKLATAAAPNPELALELEDFGSPSCLQDLFDLYEYGEPLWNGALMYLAKSLQFDEPTTIEIESLDDLPKVDMDEVERFHHGDVICKGDLGVFESTWITGNLHVAGAITVSHLDAFCDLLVGGNGKCRSAELLGLSFIGGTLDVQDIAYIWAQGENWVLGGVRGGALVGEYGSVEEMDGSYVAQHFDVKDLDPKTVAAKLEVAIQPDDTEYDIVVRALYGDS